MSRYFSGITPPDGPPVWTALNFLLCCIPPHISNTISLIVVPMGTSTSPGFVTFPVTANTFVPFDFSVPMEENQAPPFSMITGTFAHVSTLLIKVGLPHNPDTDGNGGLGLGFPLLPSMEAISAVSSPHTKAPAPQRSSISKEKSEPRIFQT